MRALGARIARALARPGGTVFLYGGLGAGKTTLVRGLLRQLGHRGAVRSPTFTLIESYSLGARQIHHLDLYRLAGREELEALGLRDLLDGKALCLIEWPERGAEAWVPPDLLLRIEMIGTTRAVWIEARSPWGREVARHVTIAKGRTIV